MVPSKPKRRRTKRAHDPRKDIYVAERSCFGPRNFVTRERERLVHLIAGYVVEPTLKGDGPGRRSRVLGQAIETIETRIEWLEAVGRRLKAEGEPSGWHWVRNERGIAELRWCVEVLRSGGREPSAWWEHGPIHPERDQIEAEAAAKADANGGNGSDASAVEH